MRVQPTHWLVGYVASGRHRPGTTGTGPATGTVLSVVDVKVPRLLRATVPAGATIADLTLRVSPADGASYEVRTRIGFSSQHKRSVVAVEGATVSRPNCATGNTRFVSSSCCA
jgi:hypothetical protein